MGTHNSCLNETVFEYPFYVIVSFLEKKVVIPMFWHWSEKNLLYPQWLNDCRLDHVFQRVCGLLENDHLIDRVYLHG